MTNGSGALPQISMLMSVFNGGAYLKASVESVFASEGVDFEFVVVDNCSTDGSREYLRGLPDPRIQLIENETNVGQTAALNIGLQHCRAPYVARLDADDLTEPRRLMQQAKALKANPEIGLVGGQMISISGDGKEIGRTSFAIDPDILSGRMIVANCFDHSSVAFRHDAVMALGGYPQDFKVSQDFALFSAIMRAGWKIANLKDVMARVRMHPDQVMAGSGAKLEKGEGARVVAENFAWITESEHQEQVGKILYRLWTGVEFETGSEEEHDPKAVLTTLFSAPKLNNREKAYLALFLLGGQCDRRFDLRALLIRAAVRNDWAALLTLEAAKRFVKMCLPQGLSKRRLA